jgi:hypothetical protein
MMNASQTMFGRDQGVYQYVAWAISQGAVDYVDVCDINGPLTHAIHQLFQLLAGRSEHAFRVLDLVITSVSFATMGACLPGLALQPESPLPSAAQRLSWAAATWAVLGVQYLSYSHWDISQRESFCNWFVLGAIATQLLAQGNAGPLKQSRRRSLLLASGMLSVLPWFIKPTYGVCTALQLILLFRWSSWRQTLAPFCAGNAIGFALMLLWLSIFGDIGAFAQTYLLDGPSLYVPIWSVSAVDLLTRTGFPNWGGYAMLLGLLFGAAVWRGTLPARALLLGLVPAAALLQIIIQGKGFDYHYHTLTMSTALGALALACAFSERPATKAVRYSAFTSALVAPVFILAVSSLGLGASPYWGDRWRAFQGESHAKDRPELSGYSYYMRYFPWDHGRTARYLEKETRPDERVFLYASSPYLLYIAKRLGAACPIYVCQLNVDAALDGRSPSRIYTPGTPLAAASAASIRGIRQRYSRETLEDLKSTQPAALVFVDDEPFMSTSNGWVDFRLNNPEAARWVLEGYELRERFGTVQIWRPKGDRSARAGRKVE